MVEQTTAPHIKIDIEWYVFVCVCVSLYHCNMCRVGIPFSVFQLRICKWNIPNWSISMALHHSHTDFKMPTQHFKWAPRFIVIKLKLSLSLSLNPFWSQFDCIEQENNNTNEENINFSSKTESSYWKWDFILEKKKKSGNGIELFLSEKFNFSFNSFDIQLDVFCSEQVECRNHMLQSNGILIIWILYPMLTVSQ